MKHDARGFTMIELVVAMAIVLILVAVSFASYQDYTRRQARTEATVNLVELGKLLQHQRAEVGGYQALKLPYTQIPLDGVARYRLTLLQSDLIASDPRSEFPALSEFAFTLRAEPVDEDGCGSLLLDQTGRRGVTSSGARVEDCWSN